LINKFVKRTELKDKTDVSELIKLYKKQLAKQ